jgi:hypothetical protein
VRIEVRKGLSRGIPVVPILLDGATVPDPEQLPDDLKRLIRRNAEFIDHRTVDADVERLIRKLRLMEQSIRPAPREPTSNRSAEAPRPVTPTEDRASAEDHLNVTGQPQPKDGETTHLKSSVRQVHWGWIGTIAALVLTIGYVGITNIPAPWRGSGNPSTSQSAMVEGKRRAEEAAKAEEDRRRAEAEAKRRADDGAAQRDPALSVNPGSGQSFRDRLANGEPCPFCPEMVVVPAGVFTMGSPPGELERAPKEAQVRVTITRPARSSL